MRVLTVKYRTRAIMVRYLRQARAIMGAMQQNAGHDHCPVNHALAVSALIGSILDNDDVACLNIYSACGRCSGEHELWRIGGQAWPSNRQYHVLPHFLVVGGVHVRLSP